MSVLRLLRVTTATKAGTVTAAAAAADDKHNSLSSLSQALGLSGVEVSIRLFLYR